MALTTPNSELAETVGRDWIKNFMKSFASHIRSERATSKVASALFIDALAGTLALAIAGRQDSEEEILGAAIDSLRDAVKRDLRHLRELGHR
jgi:glycine cleavage system pyridoxal-binding protein P